ncbi:MAG: helix-turn-helix transcriptional regulator [Rhodospirillaceae bacterium]|nr:helix-turn-helix transcriptional regulator [Rhodospirillaceae bacterium]MBL6929928.1 helix-turn-helix transcriptional regulator [Rhodospirillales bacterium]MBL6942072.1 helix-turn-helix transcriptional regulator [Rhodospirillales bacterium]
MDAKNLCLGALTCGDASGYEIKKMFEEGPFAHFHQVSFGSIYPALAKLCDEELISMREETQDGRPDKKVYSLTDNGRQALRKALKKKPADDKLRSEVMVMFFLEEFLEADHLREVFDQQLEFYRRLLAKVEGLDDSGVSHQRLFVRDFGRMFYRSIVGYMEENGHLLFGDKPQAMEKAGTDQ